MYNSVYSERSQRNSNYQWYQRRIKLLWQKYPRNNQQHGNNGSRQKIFAGEVAASFAQQKKCHHQMRWQCPDNVQVVDGVGVVGKKPQESYQQTNQPYHKKERKIKDF